MENANQTHESNNPGTETSLQGSLEGPANGRLGRWAKGTVYGFAGLVVLALGITVVSPETAVGLTQYLPQEYQETLFASAGSGGTCSAGMPVGSYGGGCCQATAGSCGAGAAGCPASAATEGADETLAATMPALSLDKMLAGLSDD